MLEEPGVVFAMGYDGRSDLRFSQQRCGRRSTVSERIPARTDRLRRYARSTTESYIGWSSAAA